MSIILTGKVPRLERAEPLKFLQTCFEYCSSNLLQKISTTSLELVDVHMMEVVLRHFRTRIRVKQDKKEKDEEPTFFCSELTAQAQLGCLQLLYVSRTTGQRDQDSSHGLCRLIPERIVVDYSRSGSELIYIQS